DALHIAKLGDAPEAPPSLHSGPTRKIDDDGNRYEVGDTEPPLDRRRVACQRNPIPPRPGHNDALEAQHRDDRCARPQPINVEMVADAHRISRWEAAPASTTAPTAKSRSELEPPPLAQHRLRRGT